MSQEPSSTRRVQSNYKPYLKNCPTLNSQEASNVNFDFTEEIYEEIQNMVQQYSEKASFYNFTPKTMETTFKLFNTWPNSYYNVCGPFICKNDRWFPIYSKKYTDTLKLANENSMLRQRIKELEEKIATKGV